MKKKKIIKEIETGYVDVETGEIISSKTLKEWSLPREEPDYVKLYFNAVLEFNAVSCANTPILLELIKYMSYADDEKGGQMIYLNKYLKDQICKNLNIKDSTLKANISKLCKGNILKRVGTGTYMANPFIFGKGDWASIKNLRASFDWNNGFIVETTEHEIEKRESIE